MKKKNTKFLNQQLSKCIRAYNCDGIFLKTVQILGMIFVKIEGIADFYVMHLCVQCSWASLNAEEASTYWVRQWNKRPCPYLLKAKGNLSVLEPQQWALQE